MTAEDSSTTPFCTWVIALEYFDGPIAGIGLRHRDQASIYFRAVAWDDDEWFRVFATAPAGDDGVARLRAALARVEAPQTPFWLPSGGTDTPDVTSAWAHVSAGVQTSSAWSLVESRDLLAAARETLVPAELTAAVGRLVKQGTILDVDGDPLLPAFLDQLRGVPRL